MRSAKFIEDHVYRSALMLKLVTEDERKHVFALVGYALRNEKETPAALLSYILRGGKRINPWRSDLAELDWAFANKMIRELVPKELSKRTGDLFTSDDFESKRRAAIKALKEIGAK